MSLYEQVRRTIKRHGLARPGDRVLVAVSGGADSVGLLLALRDIAQTEHFELAGVVHLNHQLRGEAANQDEEFCRRLAASVGLPIDVERIDVAALAQSAGVSIEQAGHDARYACFSRALTRANASSVAVAHTKDDQAETFLLRLLRGAGPRGLGGMHPRAAYVIRPFIETSRAEIGDFIREKRIEFREDASNADTAIARNRVRHELIPFLEARFARNVIEVLDRQAAIARDDAQYLEDASAAAVAALVKRAPARGPSGRSESYGSVEIPIPPLLALPPAIARRVIRAAQQLASGGRFIGFDAAEAVLALAVSNSSGPLDLPGHRVNRDGETLVLTHRVGRYAESLPVSSDSALVAPKPRSGEGGFAYDLPVPGRVRVPEAACAIVAEAELVHGGDAARRRWTLTSRGDEVVIEGAAIASPLVVRSRRPGDVFRPLGLAGRKKLQDFFVDAKVRRTERDAVPLVVDSKGRIVWVAGLSVAEEFRVTDRTRAVVILKRQPF